MNVPRTPLVGRADELAALDAALAEPGLVTLQGPGGAGKTRLLRERAARRPDAVAVMLAGIGPELLVASVAQAVGAPPDPRAIGRALAHRGRALLCLDNVEQLGAEAGRLVAALLAEAPALTVLATSRTRLGLEDERLVPLGPLPEADAVALLRDRLCRRAGPTAVSDAELAALAGHLDRLPLALELAAARIPALGVRAVSAQLGRRLDLLADAGPERPEHHRSLRAAVAGSWALLSEPERAFLRIVALLPDGFALDDLAFVDDAALGLAALVDASLLRVEHGEVTTWHLYDTVRAFVREQITPDDPLHAQVLRGLCRVAEPLRAALHGPGVAEAQAGLVRLRPALLEAAEAAEATGRHEDYARVVILVDPLLHRLGPGGWRERGLARVRALLPESHPDAIEATLSLAMTTSDVRDLPTSLPPPYAGRLAVARAKLLFDRGHHAEAETVLAEAAIPASDRRAFLGGRWILGGLHAASGALERARDALAEGLRVAREARSPLDEALFLGQLGSVLLDLGDPDAPRTLAAGIALLAGLSDSRRAIWRLRLGELALDDGRADAALLEVDAALEVMRASGNVRFEGYGRGVRARVLEALGRREEALDAYDRARDQCGHPVLGATVEAWAARALAEAGRPDAARAALERSRRVLDTPSSKLRALPDLCGAHLRLADPDRATAFAEIEALLARVTPRAHEVRAASARLRAALHAARGAGRVEGAADGSWFAWGAARTDLGTRHPIRRVWLALVAAHRGAPLGVDALFEAGWPGERAHPDAARDRVYHAIGTLRKGGLQDVLERVEGGWRLRPDVPVALR